MTHRQKKKRKATNSTKKKNNHRRPCTKLLRTKRAVDYQ